MKEIRDGDSWGDWVLEADGRSSPHLVLKINRRAKYAINLSSIDGSAEMLDWLFQLRMKRWVTNDIMGDLLSAFQDIFRPQQMLCGAGKDKHLDAESFLKKRITSSVSGARRRLSLGEILESLR
jgi:hypothetical protein